MDKNNIKLFVFYCCNSIDDKELTKCSCHKNGVELKLMILPCSGKIDIPYLIKAFETGADGVALVTCKQNECRHLEGNIRAQKRAQAVDFLLDEIGLGSGRITVIQLKDGGTEQVIKDIEEFSEVVGNMPRTGDIKKILTDVNNNSKNNPNKHQETFI
jgi:F420-non-reducing hydrogenase iron-sulfur subunit